MKKLLPLTILFTGFVSCNEKLPSPPQLQVDLPIQDIGIINFDSVYNIEYTISNSGDRDLVIDTITSSCGCSLPHLSKKIIPALDTALVRVTYKPVDEGKFDKSLVVKSNTDSVFSVLRFTGEAVVVR